MNIALVLSGGTGTRLGGEIPKQYRMVGGKPIISYCLEAFIKQEKIDAIQIVADLTWQDFIAENSNMSIEGTITWKKKLKGFSLPGENRQLSIWNGLQDICNYAGESDVVLIHDAARPLLSEKLILECLNGMERFDGVLPVLPMKDTLYLSENGEKISGLLNRSQIFAGQAPEAFRLGKYYRANKALFPEQMKQINGSTEPAIIAGMKIRMIPGDERNFKITTKDDLMRFEEIIAK